MKNEQKDNHLKEWINVKNAGRFVSGSYKHPLSPEKLPSQNCMFQPQFNKIR
jgi:hypothetical protein